MKPIGIGLVVFVACAGSLPADELQPLMTVSGKALVSEEFSGEAIPETFRTLATPDSFRIGDGALQVSARQGQERATHGAFPARAQDVTVAFSVKFLEPVTLYVGIDGYKEAFQGNTHLVRFSLTTEQMAWDQKRGGPESKHAVGDAMKAARAAKQPLPQATAEQLADPTFFRTEELATQTIRCAVGEWHQVLLEVNGNELVAQVDGQTLVATSTEAAGMKNRIGLGLTGRGTALVDHVRIWENTRRPDWEQIRSKWGAERSQKP